MTMKKCCLTYRGTPIFQPQSWAFMIRRSAGKRYDLATEGRRRANATYAQSHTTDNSEAYTYGMDLTALTEDDSLDIQNFILGYIERFKKDVAQRLQKMF